jgi:Myb-like DNA-binding domain
LYVFADLNTHTFKVIKVAVPAPPVAQAAREAAKKVALKKRPSAGKKKAGVVKKKNVDTKQRRGGSKEKSAGKNGRKATTAKRAPKIRSSAQRSKQILDAIKKHGMDDWELVASEVPDWSAEACRRRWDLYLDPTLSTEPFTKKEIRQILSFQSKEGNDWTVLAPKLERRSCSYLSKRWNKKIRKLAVGHLLELGLTEEQIEGDDEKKRINYHGHFEQVVTVVVAAQP